MRAGWSRHILRHLFGNFVDRKAGRSNFQPFIRGGARPDDRALPFKLRNAFFQHIERVLPGLRILVAGIKAREKGIIPRQITDNMIKQSIRRRESRPGAHQLGKVRDSAPRVIARGTSNRRAPRRSVPALSSSRA